jgi:hypothetical protein
MFGAWSGKGAFKGIIGGALSRHGGFLIPSPPAGKLPPELVWLHLVNQAFSAEYLPNFRLREGTNPTDRFTTAEQAFAAAFLSGEKSRLRAGACKQACDTSIATSGSISATATAPISTSFTPFPMLLPFTHIGYHLTEKHRLRLAYARSLNRPELRELAPFTYYNFALTVDQAGNATLIPATLHHVDWAV